LGNQGLACGEALVCVVGYTEIGLALKLEDIGDIVLVIPVKRK
jgi:hypothetical protein